MKKIFRIFLPVALWLVCCNGALADSLAVDPAQQIQAGAKPASDNSFTALNSAVNSLSSYYSSYFLKDMESKGLTRLDTTAVNFACGSQWNAFTYKVNTVQPLVDGNWSARQDLPMLEMGVSGDSSKDMTVKFGLGYRKLNASKDMLFGVNAFWDYTNYNSNTGSSAFGYNSFDHQRLGVGLEYMHSYFEGHANYYLPISAQQYTGSSQYCQQALNGYDVSLSATVPGAEWLKANVRGYQYFDTDAGNITSVSGLLNDFDIGATVQVTPQLSISGGYDSGGQSSYVKALFNWFAMSVTALFANDAPVDKSKDNFSSKLLSSVQRNDTVMIADER